MLVLPMTAARTDQEPAIIFQNLNDFLDSLEDNAAAHSHFFHLKIQYGTIAANTIATSAKV